MVINKDYPFDIWNEIFEYLDQDILSQLRLRSVNKNTNELKIVNFFIIDQKYLNKLNNKILKQYDYIKYLNVWNNPNITDEGIKHMTQLHSLDASWNEKITNEGIKHMTQLHSLNASYNEKITDEGIKHMTQLHSLNVSGYMKK